jgi:hypothetical protein
MPPLCHIQALFREIILIGNQAGYYTGGRAGWPLRITDMERRAGRCIITGMRIGMNVFMRSQGTSLRLTTRPWPETTGEYCKNSPGLCSPTCALHTRAGFAVLIPKRTRAGKPGALVAVKGRAFQALPSEDIHPSYISIFKNSSLHEGNLRIQHHGNSGFFVVPGDFSAEVAA